MINLIWKKQEELRQNKNGKKVRNILDDDDDDAGSPGAAATAVTDDDHIMMIVLLLGIFSYLFLLFSIQICLNFLKKGAHIIWEMLKIHLCCVHV